jgi:cob(I)alamin adenosyltransferase
MDKCFTFIKGKKLPKSVVIFEALGDLDELNAALGLARAFAPKNLNQQILQIQDDLIEIGSFLAGMKEIDLKKKTILLEEKIKPLVIPTVKTFSRPGVNKISAFLHLARATCRRLERQTTKLKAKSMKPLVPYFNSLSKLLFWLAKKEEKI